jgi:hypothetical protein
LAKLEPGREAVYSITATGSQAGSFKILAESAGNPDPSIQNPKLQEMVQILPSKITGKQ